MSNKQEEAEHVLDKSSSECLVFGCVRLWYLLYFPEVLCHLIVHYYGTTFLWIINKPDSNAKDIVFESKPFIINNITFQSYFKPYARECIADKTASSGERHVRTVKLDTKVISMSNTIRTCTAYYEYTLLNHTYKSRHTYSLCPSRAGLPILYLKGIESIKYPLDLFITVEPIRIHHWKIDKIIDYQQDILMKEYVEYEWIIDAKIRNDNEMAYLQSNVFGICWCLDLDKKKNLYLKLLRLAPNITRIKVECVLKSERWEYVLDCKQVLEFTFTNVMIKLNPEMSKKAQQFDKDQDTVFSVQMRIVEAYIMRDVDDFETNDEIIPFLRWNQYGIVFQ